MQRLSLQGVITSVCDAFKIMTDIKNNSIPFDFTRECQQCLHQEIIYLFHVSHHAIIYCFLISCPVSYVRYTPHAWDSSSPTVHIKRSLVLRSCK